MHGLRHRVRVARWCRPLRPPWGCSGRSYAEGRQIAPLRGGWVGTQPAPADFELVAGAAAFLQRPYRARHVQQMLRHRPRRSNGGSGARLFNQQFLSALKLRNPLFKLAQLVTEFLQPAWSILHEFEHIFDTARKLVVGQFECRRPSRRAVTGWQRLRPDSTHSGPQRLPPRPSGIGREETDRSRAACAMSCPNLRLAGDTSTGRGSDIAIQEGPGSHEAVPGCRQIICHWVAFDILDGIIGGSVEGMHHAGISVQQERLLRRELCPEHAAVLGRIIPVPLQEVVGVEDRSRLWLRRPPPCPRTPALDWRAIAYGTCGNEQPSRPPDRGPEGIDVP